MPTGVIVDASAGVSVSCSPCFVDDGTSEDTPAVAAPAAGAECKRLPSTFALVELPRTGIDETGSWRMVLGSESGWSRLTSADCPCTLLVVGNV